MKKLNGLSEIYQFFSNYKKPIYFVSASPLNILGLGQFIPSLRYVTYFDCFDGIHHRIFTPKKKHDTDFSSLTDVVNYLLSHDETQEFMSTQGKGGHMLTVMFDDKTQKLAKELGIKIALPSHKLRNKLDSKIVTTKLGNDAGVASVPNALGKGSTYQKLRELADKTGLGEHLVVQTPYGDSGKTTFFISSEKDWKKHQKHIVGEEIKVMKRISPKCGTIEAVATRHGTLVGPVLSEIVGHKELTPYKGGWSGNEADQLVVSDEQKIKVTDMVKKFGDRLYKEGYKGTFCIDYLIDKETDEIYLGELNPRVSGASPVTNLITQKYGGAPLLMFHLLEHLGVDYDIDLDEIQKRWMAFDAWSTVVFKHTSEELRRLDHVPRSGIYRMSDQGNCEIIRRTADWSNASGLDEAFFLRILGPGEYLYKGADMGVLLVRGKMQTPSDKLTLRAKNWVKELRGQFQSSPLEEEAHPTLSDREMLYKIY